jgi:hypothetical protein
VGKFANSKTGKAIRNRIMPFALLLLIAFIAAIGTPSIPALGLPSFKLPWLAAALVMYAFYEALPGEFTILEDAMKNAGVECAVNRNDPINIRTKRCQANPTHATRAVMQVGTEHIGWLYGKSFLKLLAIIFTMVQFAVSNWLLLATIFAFIAYFTLPVSYKKSHPYKAAEAWFRMGLGLVMAVLLTVFLSPNADVLFGTQVLVPILITFGIAFAMIMIEVATHRQLYTIVFGLVMIVIANALFLDLAKVPQLAMFYLTVAFFMTSPKREDDKETRAVNINVVAGLVSDFLDKREKQWEDIGTGIFLAFAILAGIPIIGSWVAGSADLQWILGITWIVALFMGSVGGREGRPYIGSMLLLFALFGFSSAYGQTIGTAVFGGYWGSVQAGTGALFGPITAATERGSCEAAAAYSCITEGPIVCADARLQCERAKAVVVGTDRSIQFEEIKSVTPEYDPAAGASTISYVFTNAGEYDARNVELEVPDKHYPNVTRVVGVEEKEGTDIGSIIMDEASCIGSKYIGDNKCSWEGVFRPGARGAGLITIKWDGNTKDYRGMYPWILFRTSYDYTVHASYAIDVRSKDELQRILLGGESIAGTVGQYSGGPITAALWTPKYIQSGTFTLVQASLTNTKDGVAQNANFCVYVPAEAVIDESSFSGGGAHDATEQECPAVTGAKAVLCHWESISSAADVDKQTAKPRNSQNCNFKLSIDISPAPQKQLAIVGNADFRYVLETVKKDVPITSASEVG